MPASHKEPCGMHGNEKKWNGEAAEVICPPMAADGGQVMTRADS